MPSNCPRCDAALKGTETACPACKRPLTAGPAPVGAIEIKCPVCKIKTYAGTLGDQEVIHCAECEGTGIKREAMMKFQPGGPKEFVKGPEEREHVKPPYFEKRNKPPFLICPFCGKKMKAEKLGPMNIDQCEKCSALWLEGAKAKHLNDLIGPYKWKASKSGSSGGSSRRRR